MTKIKLISPNLYTKIVMSISIIFLFPGLVFTIIKMIRTGHLELILQFFVFFVFFAAIFLLWFMIIFCNPGFDFKKQVAYDFKFLRKTEIPLHKIKAYKITTFTAKEGKKKVKETVVIHLYLKQKHNQKEIYRLELMYQNDKTYEKQKRQVKELLYKASPDIYEIGKRRSRLIEMSLSDGSFKAILNGKKRIELRLWDEKRSELKIGDEILFTHFDTQEEIQVQIIKLHYDKNFFQIYEKFDKEMLGYDLFDHANAEDMYTYYSKSEIDTYGIVAIEFELAENKQ